MENLNEKSHQNFGISKVFLAKNLKLGLHVVRLRESLNFGIALLWPLLFDKNIEIENELQEENLIQNYEHSHKNYTINFIKMGHLFWLQWELLWGLDFRLGV